MYRYHTVLKSVFYVCLLSVVFAQWYVDDDGCRTPDRGVGNCVLAKDCRPLLDFLQKVPRPVPNEVKEELNKYTCGYQGNSVKVCCPSGPIVIAMTDNLMNADKDDLDNPPPPPDVTNHKNYRLLPEDCGYLGLFNKIRNGQDARLFEYPWMALLSYRTSAGPQFQCGGTVLNEKYILTAAHCISDLAFPLLGVRVGEHAISTPVDCELDDNNNTKCSPYPVQDLAIEQVIVHPGFSKRVIIDDIGLLRVSKMNIEVENVRPVCLPVDEDTKFAKINFSTITGWGFTESYGNNADVLQTVNLPSVDLKECREIYKNEQKVKITYKQLCAGGRDEKDSCPGDSGGPMQVASYLNDQTRLVQQGIVSFGHRFCGTPGYPGVYTRVAYYMDWILDNIRP